MTSRAREQEHMFVEELTARLRESGQASRQFLTGASDIFHSPPGDIVFVPFGGAHADEIYVFEVKFVDSNIVSDVVLLSAISHAQAIANANKNHLRFAFIINTRLSARQRNLLLHPKNTSVETIQVFDGALPITTLLNMIYHWTGVPMPRSAYRNPIKLDLRSFESAVNHAIASGTNTRTYADTLELIEKEIGQAAPDALGKLMELYDRLRSARPRDIGGLT